MRRKQLSSAVALAGIVSTLFFGIANVAHSAPAGVGRNAVRQPLLSGSGKLIAYAPPATASGGDYLEAVSQNGAHRWAAERLPLKVYIDGNSRVPGYRDSFKALLSKSFDEWCRISNCKLSWQEVSSPQQADIACNYSDTPRKSGPGGFEAGVTNTIIQQNRYTGQSSIQRATMTILTQWRGRVFTDSEIYMTSLHEVGHAMGMQGHSNIPSDIMYASVNRQQTPVLSQRDVNTVARLYKNYGTEPSIAFNSRRNSNGYPQVAPRGRTADRNSFASGSGGVVQADGLQPFAPVDTPDQADSGIADQLERMLGGGRRGGRGSRGASQDYRGASQDYRGGAQDFGGNQRFGGNQDFADPQGAQAFDPQGGGQDFGGQGFGGGPDFSGGGQGFAGRRLAGGQGFDGGQGFGGGQGFAGSQGQGSGWHRGGGRRARWRSLDPAQRAALMARRQQMQGQMMQQGFAPDAGFMQDGFMPQGGFGGF